MSDCSWVLAQRAVDRRSHSAQGCTRGGTSDTHAPHLHAVDISADVAGSLSVITSGTRVLAVLQNLEVNLQLFQSIGIRGDRAVALSKDLGFLAVVEDRKSTRLNSSHVSISSAVA